MVLEACIISKPIELNYGLLLFTVQIDFVVSSRSICLYISQLYVVRYAISDINPPRLIAEARTPNLLIIRVYPPISVRIGFQEERQALP